MSAIKFKVGEPKKVTLSFDSPKSGTNNYGAWYLYGIKSDINSEEDGFFATETLHTMIQTLGAKEGSEIKIEKCQDGDVTFFKVNDLSMNDMNSGGAFEKIAEAKPTPKVTLDPDCTDMGSAVIELDRAKKEIKKLKEELEVLRSSQVSENDIPF